MDREALNPSEIDRLVVVFEALAKVMGLAKPAGEWLTIEEAAARCRVTEGTINKMIREGRLSVGGTPGRPGGRRRGRVLISRRHLDEQIARGCPVLGGEPIAIPPKIQISRPAPAGQEMKVVINRPLRKD